MGWPFRAELGKPDVFAWIHFEIQGQRLGRIWSDDFGLELYEDRVFAKHRVLVHRLEIDGDKERPRHFGMDAFPALYTQHLRDFEQLHAGIHHHFLDSRRRNFGPEFKQNNVMNHASYSY
jgi:hypothetical protein